MRWMWIDRIVELVPAQRLVAIKHVSLAEEHLHDHFPAVVNPDGLTVRAATPIMPACFIIEGMAQTAGVLVGHAEGFRHKVALAKVNRVELTRDAQPGDTLRYTATLRQLSAAGASTEGQVELISPTTQGQAAPVVIGRIDLMFSQLENNLAGVEFPAHNFVFSESFKTLLRTSGITDIGTLNG